MNDFKELREALDAGPTAGPWIAAGPSFGAKLPVYCNEVVTDRADEDECEIVCQAPSELAAEVTVDMHYIAAANPATIRALLAELDEARKDAERWRMTRLLARYTGDGGDWLDLGRLPWPRTGHATTPDYADAAIDAMKEQQP